MEFNRYRLDDVESARILVKSFLEKMNSLPTDDHDEKRTWMNSYFEASIILMSKICGRQENGNCRECARILIKGFTDG